jgi:DNA-binding ferritin-like protein (Dps family)
MSESSNSLKHYYKTGNYKGFYQIRERVYKLSAKTHLTFSNGEKELFASGQFKEEALNKIFAQIDEIVAKEELSETENDLQCS